MTVGGEILKSKSGERNCGLVGASASALYMICRHNIWWVVGRMEDWVDNGVFAGRVDNGDFRFSFDGDGTTKKA